MLLILDLEKPTDELQADWARVLGVISRSQDYITMSIDSGLKKKKKASIHVIAVVSESEAIPTIL